ncbi:Ras- protein Rab-4A [Aspergillus nanangensis]|uniref:Ras- protein Rab-4A n=1 Tax=Aspergillus nanangensis TaxID=2582783 RepID=A0AAD4CBQ7_ASPNN|nr:Ras- protein Rab-4A [Aspergillus nanangensis]
MVPPPVDIPSANHDVSSRLEICVSPTWNKSTTPKKERRATRRLEAERIELEKRLMKLEQAGQNQNASQLRREPRRLTKKQPISSSNSRTSSVGPEEPRSRSRFSSVFSRHTSRSRSHSRSSSINGEKRTSRPHSAGHEDTPVTKQTTGSPAPFLSTTLPERFGIAVSNGLSTKNNALLTRPEEKATTASDSYGNGIELGTNGANTAGALDVPTFDGGQVKPGGNDVYEESHSTEDRGELQDLDRISFAAALNLDKRGSEVERKQEVSSRFYSQQKPNQADGHCENTEGPLGPALEYGLGTLTPGTQTPPSNLHPGSPRALHLVQRRHRRFTSSPLAGSPTLSDDTAPTTTTATSRTLSGRTDVSCSSDLEKTRLSRSRLLNLSFSRQGNGKNVTGVDQATRSSVLQKTDSELSPTGYESHQAPSDTVHGPQKSDVTARNQLGMPITLVEEPQLTAQTQAHHTSSPMGLLGNAIAPSFESQQKHESLSTNMDSKHHTSRPQASSLGDRNVSRYQMFDHSPEHRTLKHETATSAISVATSLSHESDDYNTADEEAPHNPQLHIDESVMANDPAKVLPVYNFQTAGGKSPEIAGNPPVIPRSGSTRRARFFENFRRQRHGQLVAKLFVICCSCEFWHDMPSEEYARLAFPSDGFVSTGVNMATQMRDSAFDKRTNAKHGTGGGVRSSGKKLQGTAPSGQRKKQELSSSSLAITSSSAVQCCWCEHYMKGNQELESMYDYLAKVILLGPSGTGKIKLQLWDTAGTERFRSVSRSYYRGAAGAILAYDVSSHQSFASLPTFLMDARALASPNLTVILAGNKADLTSDHVPHGDFDDGQKPPPTPSSTSSRQSSFPYDSGGGSVRSIPNFGSGTRMTASYAPQGREVSAEETSHWAAKSNIPVAVEVSALTGDGVDELFNRLARIILTKIELGEIDPDDPQSGIQYGDGGLFGHATSDASSVRSGITLEDSAVQLHHRNPRKKGANKWKSGMREWEDVFRLSGSQQKKGGGCC